MAITKAATIGDVIRWEADGDYSRATLTILSGSTMGVGYIGGRTSTGVVVPVGSLADDVYTLTKAAGTASGEFGVNYRGVETSAMAFDVNASALQTTLRNIHVDLDSCVCASAGETFTVTVPTEKKSGLFHPTIGLDSTVDGGVWEGGITISRTTIAEHPSVIGLEAADWAPTASGGGAGVFLVRNARVIAAALTGGSADVYNRLMEPQPADDYENGAGYGGILVSTGPTMTTLV